MHLNNSDNNITFQTTNGQTVKLDILERAILEIPELDSMTEQEDHGSVFNHQQQQQQPIESLQIESQPTEPQNKQGFLPSLVASSSCTSVGSANLKESERESDWENDTNEIADSIEREKEEEAPVSLGNTFPSSSGVEAKRKEAEEIKNSAQDFFSSSLPTPTSSEEGKQRSSCSGKSSLGAEKATSVTSVLIPDVGAANKNPTELSGEKQMKEVAKPTSVVVKSPRPAAPALAPAPAAAVDFECNLCGRRYKFENFLKVHQRRPCV